MMCLSQAALARYIQSDPIGLAGGLNTYGYALNNPLYWSDPLGLDIVPVGTPQQKAAINKALEKLKNSNPTTRSQVEALENSNNIHTVRFPFPNERPVNKTTGIRKNESNGIGTGSETVCDVTTDFTLNSGLNLSGESVLAHELLGHGLDKDRGVIDRSINPTSNQKFSEESAMNAANIYRKSVDQKLRNNY